MGGGHCPDSPAGAEPLGRFGGGGGHPQPAPPAGRPEHPFNTSVVTWVAWVTQVTPVPCICCNRVRDPCDLRRRAATTAVVRQRWFPALFATLAAELRRPGAVPIDVLAAWPRTLPRLVPGDGHWAGALHGGPGCGGQGRAGVPGGLGDAQQRCSISGLKGKQACSCRESARAVHELLVGPFCPKANNSGGQQAEWVLSQPGANVMGC